LFAEYIDKFVLCKRCGLPELNNNGCNACGHSLNKHKDNKNKKVKEKEKDKHKEPIGDKRDRKLEKEAGKIIDLLFARRSSMDQRELIDKMIDDLWNVNDEVTLDKIRTACLTAHLI